MINSDKLKAKIVENGLKQTVVAKALDISPTTLNYKINKKTKFTTDDISKLIRVLKLSCDDVMAIFFPIV